MEIIQNIINWFGENWVQLGVALWLLEQALRTLSKVTPWTWDDNLVDVIANVLGTLFPKKTEEK